MIVYRVKLVIPDADTEEVREKIKHWRLCGEHYAYHNRVGTILCGAGDGGVWVRFDGQGRYNCVGCPLAWLEFIEQKEAEHALAAD